MSPMEQAIAEAKAREVGLTEQVNELSARRSEIQTFRMKLETLVYRDKLAKPEPIPDAL